MIKYVIFWFYTAYFYCKSSCVRVFAFRKTVVFSFCRTNSWIGKSAGPALEKNWRLTVPAAPIRPYCRTRAQSPNSERERNTFSKPEAASLRLSADQVDRPVQATAAAGMRDMVDYGSCPGRCDRWPAARVVKAAVIDVRNSRNSARSRSSVRTMRSSSTARCSRAT